MKMRSLFAALAVGLTMLQAQGVGAAEIKVLSIPFKGPLDEIRSEFERTTARKLLIRYAPSAELRRQIAAGEEFDLVLIFPGQIDDLIKQGKVAVGTRVDIARAGLGVAVKKGVPLNPISRRLMRSSACCSTPARSHTPQQVRAAYT